MQDLLVIDGSKGEGGGQILRTALGLALATLRPFRIENVRAGRKSPGLMRQHLTAVRAAAQIGCAEVTGAEIGSQRLTFRPGATNPGLYEFAVGTAGSATLVLQTVLPALALCSEPSYVILEGGTHNPFAPPFDFAARSFAPILERIGVRLGLTLERHGFYPAGGGRVMAEISRPGALSRIDIMERGPLEQRRARALVSRIPVGIAHRELQVVRERLGWERAELDIEEVTRSPGPGNMVALELRSRNVTEICAAFGERGRRAEDVAEDAVAQMQRYLAADAPVGEHLADQLLIPMALAGGGTFRTLAPSGHTLTNAEIVQRFLPVRIVFAPEADRDGCLVTISSA
jgi:RNA 3'-terminal phosphate cyclase (ATP)